MGVTEKQREARTEESILRENWRQAEDKLAATSSRERVLREALRKLSNEIYGWLELEEDALVKLLSRTNVTIMRDRIAIARAALKEAQE